MHEAIKEAVTICKTLLRNGFDAHVINAPLQEELLSAKNSRNRTPNNTDSPDIAMAVIL